MLPIKSNIIPANQNMKMVDDPHAKEFFVDEIVGANFVNGTCALTFARLQSDHSNIPPVNYRIVSGRIRGTMPAMIALHQVLGRLIADAGQPGVMVPPAPTPIHPVVQ